MEWDMIRVHSSIPGIDNDETVTEKVDQRSKWKNLGAFGNDLWYALIGYLAGCIYGIP